MHSQLKHQGYFYGALLYAFIVPFPQKLVNISLMIWGALSLYGYSKPALFKNRNLWFLPAFYVTYFMGFFTSETINLKFLEYKLSLLIFPLLFFLHFYDEEQLRRILRTLILGLTASIATCLLMAFYNSIDIQDGVVIFQPNVLEDRGFMESIIYGGNYFFGRYLSIFHQTVYYALYLCIGIAVLLFKRNLFSARIQFVLLLVFIGFIFLVSNKASFLVLALVLAIKIWSWKGNRMQKSIGISLITLLMALFTFFNPRMNESVRNIVGGKLILDKEARYGFATRLLSWDAAISLIRERPILGYGHTDTQEALNNKYESKGYVFPLKGQYNAHNLWLQSWLENGIPAIIVLLGIFWILFKCALVKKCSEPLLLSIACILLVNSMFEGMFNRFSGISFFSFLFCLVISWGESKK